MSALRELDVALALVCRKDRWLVGRRAEGRVFAGLWEFPGGKMNAGESAEEAAVRETREETGLAIEPRDLLDTVVNVHDGNRVRLHLVHCTAQSDAVTACDDAVLEVRWVTLEELRCLPMPPVNAQIIERIASLRHA